MNRHAPARQTPFSPTAEIPETTTQDAIEGVNFRAGRTTLIVDGFTLSAGDIAAKGVLLSQEPPFPNKVELTPYGGPQQWAGVDFIVSGNALSWESLALELLLEEGSSITVTYAIQ